MIIFGRLGPFFGATSCTFVSAVMAHDGSPVFATLYGICAAFFAYQATIEHQYER